MKFETVKTELATKGWILSKLNSTFYGYKYQMKSTFSNYQFAKNLNECIEISKGSPYPYCKLNLSIPYPLKFSN